MGPVLLHEPRMSSFDSGAGFFLRRRSPSPHGLDIPISAADVDDRFDLRRSLDVVLDLLSSASIGRLLRCAARAPPQHKVQPRHGSVIAKSMPQTSRGEFLGLMRMRKIIVQLLKNASGSELSYTTACSPSTNGRGCGVYISSTKTNAPEASASKSGSRPPSGWDYKSRRSSPSACD